MYKTTFNNIKVIEKFYYMAMNCYRTQKY